VPRAHIFFDDILQNPLREQGLRQQLLQLRVLLFELLQPSGLVEIHLTELLLPTVEGNFGDVLLLADLHDAFAAVGGPQNVDLVLG
jgi:hypothetical protein